MTTVSGGLLVGSAQEDLRSDIVRGSHPQDRHAHRWPRHQDGAPDRCEVGVLTRAHGSPCSPAAKPRHWSRPRWAPARTNRSSMRSRASTASTSCCTTTSRPIRSVKRRSALTGRREIGHGKLAWRACIRCCRQGRLPLHHPRRLGDHRVERLVLDGDGLRCVAVA